MRHFKLHELIDRKTYEEEGEAAWGHFNPEALEALDDLRDFFGRGITVNSWAAGGPFQFRGYRPPWYQPGVTPGSQHRKGNAFDCDVRGYTAAEARELILANQDNPLLARITRIEGGVTWLHFDLAVLPEDIERIYVFKAA